MRWDLTEKERKDLIKYMWDVGFIFQVKPFMELKTDEERHERIKSLVNDGYRIQLWGARFDIINIKGVCISEGIIKELTESYNYLRADKEDD